MAPQGTHILDVANHIATPLRTTSSTSKSSASASKSPPNIVFLQEVEDNDGGRNASEDDGVVSASLTLSTSVAAIANASGVTYTAFGIDPVNDEDSPGILASHSRSA